MYVKVLNAVAVSPVARCAADPGRPDQVPGRPDLTSSTGEKIQVGLRPEDFPGRPEVQLVKFPTSTSLKYI